MKLDVFTEVQKARGSWGEDHEQLPERHDASDFETKTVDKLEAAAEAD